MITDRAVLLAVRRAPYGHTSVESFIAAHGVTKCRPSRKSAYRPTKMLNCANAHSRTGRIVRTAAFITPSDGPRVSSVERLAIYQSKYRHKMRMGAAL